MTPASISRKKYIKLLFPAYFLLLGQVDVVADIFFSKNGLSTSTILLSALLSMPFFIRKKYVYLLCGIVFVIIFALMLIVLLILLAQHLQGRHYKNPLLYFGTGFPFCFLSIGCSFVLI